MKRNSFLSNVYELLSSMRFAVSLLTLLAIALVIGTVLQQNQPYSAYHIEFGPYWFEAWRVLGLYDVYHAPWFLLILAFLVVSTGVCILRNTPGFLRQMRGYRERARVLSLHHHERWAATGDPAELAQRAQAILRGLGFRTRLREQDEAIVVAGKAGSWQKLGYFLTHSAIVLICVGGLIDSNLSYQLQNWFGDKRPAPGMPRSDAPASSRLGVDNLSFRANVNLAEGSSSDIAFIDRSNGYLVQELPFTVHLRRFHIEHYSTGQPKLFASDIVVVDKKTGRRTEKTIEVNKPLRVDGVTIYQASFSDGGSALDLRLWDDAGMRPLKSVSQEYEQVMLSGQAFTMELGDFRLFNIEPSGKPPQKDNFDRAMSVRQDKQMQNVGPSISYKLRNASGQAREYQSYMSPIPIGGRDYWVTGVRDEIGAAFRYLQIPLETGSADAFMRLRAEFGRADTREAIAELLAAQMIEGQVAADMREPFRRSVLGIAQAFDEGGFAALDRLVAAKVPQAQRPMMQETNFRILLAFAWQAELKAAARAGLPAPTWSDDRARYLVDALRAMSDWQEMALPGLVQLISFEEVKASGLQLTRSPGMSLVYLGSLLLVLGMLIMFYVRERRIWVRLQGGEVLFAMSCNQRDQAFEAEFDHIKTHLPLWLEEALDERRI